MIAKITWALIHDCKFNEKIGNIFEVQIFNTIFNRFLHVDGLNATERFFNIYIWLELELAERKRFLTEILQLKSFGGKQETKSPMFIRRLLGWAGGFEWFSELWNVSYEFLLHFWWIYDIRRVRSFTRQWVVIGAMTDGEDTALLRGSVLS